MHQRNFSLRKESTFRPLKWLLRTSKEIPYWWRVTTQFWLVVPWVKFASTNQKHYPDLVSDAYGVSTLVSQTTFREETSGDVAKGRLFSQAKELFLLTKSSVRNCVRPFMLKAMKCLTYQLDEVSTHQCHMTVSRAQVYNPLSWRVFKKSPLTSYGNEVITGSEDICLKLVRELCFWPCLNYIPVLFLSRRFGSLR